MTHYYYKGKEITHLQLLSIFRHAGINGGQRMSILDYAARAAQRGNAAAVNLLNDISYETGRSI